MNRAKFSKYIVATAMVAIVLGVILWMMGIAAAIGVGGGNAVDYNWFYRAITTGMWPAWILGGGIILIPIAVIVGRKTKQPSV